MNHSREVEIMCPLCHETHVHLVTLPNAGKHRQFFRCPNMGQVFQVEFQADAPISVIQIERAVEYWLSSLEGWLMLHEELVVKDGHGNVPAMMMCMLTSTMAPASLKSEPDANFLLEPPDREWR